MKTFQFLALVSTILGSNVAFARSNELCKKPAKIIAEGIRSAHAEALRGTLEGRVTIAELSYLGLFTNGNYVVKYSFTVDNAGSLDSYVIELEPEYCTLSGINLTQRVDNLT